jgi:hypothetical protein
LLSLLLTVLCWDAVTTDVNGRPEPLSHYSVVTAASIVVGWYPPTVDVPFPQPIYASEPGPLVADVPPAPGQVCTSIPDDPPEGGVYYYVPRAWDYAGNGSN